MRVSKRVPTGIHEVLAKFEKSNFHVNLNHDTEKGVTTLKIEHNENALRAVGVSHCSPRDNFDRATGTKIAFTRAMQDMRMWIGRDAVKQILK